MQAKQVWVLNQSPIICGACSECSLSQSRQTEFYLSFFYFYEFRFSFWGVLDHGSFHMLFRIFCLTACVWVQTMGQFSVALKLLALLQQYKENTEEAEVVP